MSWDCGLKYMFSVSPVLQPGGLSILPDKEDLSGLEMVQRLAKDGCRFLQHHSKGPERTSEVRNRRCRRPLPLTTPSTSSPGEKWCKLWWISHNCLVFISNSVVVVLFFVVGQDKLISEFSFTLTSYLIFVWCVIFIHSGRLNMSYLFTKY